MISFDMVLLTMSSKYGGYCVAGIDLQSKRWRRLVTANEAAQGALGISDLYTRERRRLERLDCIRVHGGIEMPERVQSENVLLGKGASLEFIRHMSIRELLWLYTPERRTRVFLGDSHVMYGVEGLTHSLEMMLVNDFHAYFVLSGGTHKPKADFTLAGTRYKNFAITDRSLSIIGDQGCTIPRVCVVFSISDNAWARANGHYKYISAIYPLGQFVSKG